jgi:phospholipid/cholesterol/gamma-HCH transport system substrate-binding protein
MVRNPQHTSRLSYFQWGLLCLVGAVALTYFGFTKSVPFRDHYEVKAAFKSANNLRTGSLVRIAGVNVGKVTKVEFKDPGSENAVVTLRIDKQGRPIHKDAQVTLRQRIFLEGNLFVDVKPGTPSAPELQDGDMIPVNQTSYPVQLDQVLTALQRDTRDDLRVLLDQYSTALGGDGAPGFNRSIPYWEPAYKNSAIVNEATLGITEGDLAGYIKNAGATAAALDRNSGQLRSLITDFNTTAGAFARESGNLEAAVAELPRTLGVGMPALASLNEAFPPTRALAADLRPAVRSTGPTIDASRPLVAQLRGLVSRPELRGLVADLRPTVPALSSLTRNTVPLYKQVSLASSCQNEVILPWTRDTVPDDFFKAKGPVYQESVKWLPGISGESRSGDANGQYFRVLAGGGNFTATYGKGIFATLTNPLQGTNPPKPQPSAVSPTGRPPIDSKTPCETQERPNLSTVVGSPPPQMRNDIDTTAEKLEYVKSRSRAVDWLREELKLQGMDGLFNVADSDLPAGKLEDLANALAPGGGGGGRGAAPVAPADRPTADGALPAPGPGQIGLPGIGNVKAPPPPVPTLVRPEDVPSTLPTTATPVAPNANGVPILGDSVSSLGGGK